MAKVDLKKELKHLYDCPAGGPVIVEVPAMNFIMVDGAGDPNNSPEFSEAVEALYGLSYTLKFKLKKGEAGTDYGVMPLEGLWWTDDMREFSLNARDRWKWTLMILQPEFVTADLYLQVLEEVRKKKGLPVLARVRFERFHEGLSAQIMHSGPYSAEEPTVSRLHRFIAENGDRRIGKHHEIYLGDPRRIKPEKLKTIIRQPIA
ncbi:MAG: GyrI-like domain-containing protein [Clostridia bacterium]|nr:GyrI-like domain-containing protein [Clostridia bacterium]